MNAAGGAEFWAKVDKSGACWIWRGAKTKDGYGQVKRRNLAGGRNIRAHRYVWFLAHGELPSNFLLHRCDNPACVRLEHLFLGGHQENSDDKVAKGRQSRTRLFGEKNGSAKLTEEQVRQVKSSHLPGRKLAKQLGVSESRISLIRSGKTWRHVQV